LSSARDDVIGIAGSQSRQAHPPERLDDRRTIIKHCIV
jgi:hypothetical protein